MIYAPLVITAPVKEPVSIAEVRQHIRVDAPADSGENTKQENEITLMIRAARHFVEKTTGRTIHQQTLEWVLDVWPSDNFIALRRATPLVSITSLKYKDKDGVESTVATTEYIADTDSTPGRLVLAYGKSWPSATLYPVHPIRARYVAGIATTSPVTEAGDEFKIPMLLLIGGLWENRESEVITDRARIEAIALQWSINKFITDLTVH